MPVHYVFLYYAIAHILTHLVKLAFGPKSEFKNKCPAWAEFGLQIETCLQL